MERGVDQYSAITGVKGFTILEVMIVITILGILLMIVTPATKSTIDKQRVRGACESIYQTLALARSSAVTLNKNVSLNFRSSNAGATWCVGLYDGAACDCSTNANLCTVNSIKRSASSTEFGTNSSIKVVGISNNTTVTFSARDMTPSSTPTIRVSSGLWACALEVAPLGQVRFLKTGIGTSSKAVVPIAESGGLY